jgi:RNA polymerase sigma-70 factor (ECF subfamily)
MSCEHQNPVQADTTGIEYINALYGYAMSLTCNYAEAEDLVQETYVRAIPAIGRLREESNIKGWLFKILRNVWLNQLRKQRNGPQFVPTDLECGFPCDVPDPGRHSYDIYVSKLDSRQIRAAIEKLPTDFREIILLREFEELSYHEIAVILGCPAGTVMSRLARARSSLRMLLSSTVARPKPFQEKIGNDGLR